MRRKKNKKRVYRAGFFISTEDFEKYKVEMVPVMMKQMYFKFPKPENKAKKGTKHGKKNRTN